MAEEIVITPEETPAPEQNVSLTIVNPEPPVVEEAVTEAWRAEVDRLREELRAEVARLWEKLDAVEEDEEEVEEVVEDIVEAVVEEPVAEPVTEEVVEPLPEIPPEPEQPKGWDYFSKRKGR